MTSTRHRNARGAGAASVSGRRGRHRHRPRRRRAWRLGIALTLLLVGLPVLLLLSLRLLPPPTTAYMLQSPVQPVRYDWVPARQISDYLKLAVVASEDQRFYRHRGFDLDAIQQALAERADGGRLRGASTISQQLARNLFLWPGGGFLRKGLEAGITVLIEGLWPKRRILEVYLNVVEFGPGIYGAEAAAMHWYGVPARALTPDQAARLAAILPSPRNWSAQPPGDYVRARADWILGQTGLVDRAR